jgi:uncharacterized protein
MLRWTGWFGIANGAILLLIGSRYVFAIPLPSDALAWGYMAMASVSQFALLATLPLFLLCSPLVLFKARRRWVSGMGIIVGALLLTLLILDTNIFDQYRYHMSGLTIAIFETSTWFFAGIVFCSMLVFEFMLAGVVWQFCLQPQHGKTGVWLAVVLVSLGLTGQVVHVWADATSYVPVTQFTRVLPLYYPLKAKRSLMKFGLLDEAEMQRLRSINLAKIPDGGQLNYPLAPLQCSATALPNILFVVVDAMRRDHIAPELTPTLAQFATESLDFRNHYSGGNSSRMGFFSMFYGMPSTYWQTFYSAQESPVFMRQINSAGYQMALFSGVGFGSPSQIDRTVFADNQQSLQAVEGLDDAASIRAVTDGFTDWLAAYDRNSPFFGLLYFDPGSSWKAPAGVDESALSEAEVVHAGYRRGLRLIDAEVERVLAALDAAGVVDDTLVIIASDHGYEFDELGLGYIGHASNFSRWQLMSTLMLRWPGKEPMVYTHRSAHQDLPVTLLQEVFDCSNPPTEYASGKSLFDTVDWDWLVAGSYNAYAIVQPDKVVVTYPGGRTEVLDETYKPSNELTIDVPVVQDVMLEMTRFYQ